jgi:uncharacterized protein
MMQIGYPFRIDERGRVASATFNRHIQQMVEQILFTQPGERVNRPDFGSGVQQLIFAPNHAELAAATEFLVKGSLEQWLGEAIEVEAVNVRSEDASLQIAIQYRIRQTQESQIVEFSRNG